MRVPGSQALSHQSSQAAFARGVRLRSLGRETSTDVLSDILKRGSCRSFLRDGASRVRRYDGQQVKSRQKKALFFNRFCRSEGPSLFRLSVSVSSDKQTQAIMKHKEGGDFQLACKEFFLQTHPGSAGDDVGNHPNAFFAASRRFFTSRVSDATKTSRQTTTPKADTSLPSENAVSDGENCEAMQTA